MRRTRDSMSEMAVGLNASRRSNSSSATASSSSGPAGPTWTSASADGWSQHRLRFRARAGADWLCRCLGRARPRRGTAGSALLTGAHGSLSAEDVSVGLEVECPSS